MEIKKAIYNTPEHKVIFFEELTPASAVQSNQVLIIHKGEGMLLDQGGHKVSSKLLKIHLPLPLGPRNSSVHKRLANDHEGTGIHI